MDFSGIFGFLMPLAEDMPVLRAIIGFILVFFVPGFAWTLVFFPRVNVIERIALSIGLSIAIVTLSIMVMNALFGVRITGDTSLLTIIVVTVIALAIYFLKRYLARQPKASDGD